MRRGQLRRQCEALLRGIDFPQPFDIGVLCRRLGESRGRPIRLAPISLPAESPCGLLVSTAEADYIFYEARSPATHQTHVIAHELGHLLWNHQAAASPLVDQRAHLLLPNDIDPVLIQRMFGRSHYADPEEWAAEYFATQLLRQVSEWTPRPPSVPSEAAELVGRLERSLDHGREGST
ncbi:ImmA/IrrE family metallo-endopeptidase [Streptomyces sp. H10-C2]|uniref:ImmA/IrrE family metallo-endopeptidase n=1 Tax=unclassified Streptomyces TaxID=2593676 RepID=UPI0024B9D507|nr:MULTISPECIES: ImmA/IrrE family metallo-endopeptidase [unclassified Streptomyces]MDJ0344113.1 ImmA/IrrE family metallo-endopeptidase [Streptomyces sp. PH10-H1]MDJ0374869.1 ImmA/IrrE family metallo-endopeptidase [Streptomyces sp. H10-C2]